MDKRDLIIFIICTLLCVIFGLAIGYVLFKISLLTGG